MVGIEALGAYPQLGKHLLFIIWELGWSKAMLCVCVCVCVCVCMCLEVVVGGQGLTWPALHF